MGKIGMVGQWIGRNGDPRLVKSFWRTSWRIDGGLPPKFKLGRRSGEKWYFLYQNAPKQRHPTTLTNVGQKSTNLSQRRPKIVFELFWHSCKT